MPFRRCFAHCPHGSAILYPFPPKTDVARRDLWIRQFGKNPDQFKQKHLYACRKHFSSYMTYGRLLRKNGYPDVNLSTYDKDKPYTQRFSYYKPGAKPDPFWHDNLDDVVAMPPLDYGMDLEYVPVECIVPLSNELSHTEDSNSSDDEDIQLKKKSNYVDRKRKCILGCGGKRSLHILPSIHNELERRQKWLYLVGKDPALYTQRHVYVCDLHFDIHMVGKSHLIRGAYPNKNLPPPLIKSIPERLEAETECLQKCSDYKRKFKFPTFDRKRRETWLLKFGRNPAFYTNDIYACDRHFSDEMRVGPYLQSHAVPDQNLALKLLHEDNTGNYVIKTWSLERLQALANATTTSLTVTTTTTTHSTALISPTVTTIATTTTVISPTDTITDSTTTKILPSVTASTTISPTVTTTTTIDSPHKNLPQTPTIDGTAQSKNILDQLKMTVMSTANQTSQTPVEYVKMKTLGVFMQHRDGYVVPLRQILNAVDPLDCRGYLLTEYAKSIEPKLTIKVHPIPKEIYEGISDDDTKMSASPTYKDDTVEESDEDAKMLKFTHAYGEQNSTDSWSHEDNNDFSSNLENAQIYNIKRNNYYSGYTTAKKVKFTHTFDDQQNNGDLGGQEDNTDYSNSLENAQIYNIKRNNYDSGYTTAKKVKFTHAFDEQQNNGDLGGQEVNNDYSNSLENAQIYNIKRNNYNSSYITAKKVTFTHTYDEQHNNGDLLRHEDNNDYSNSLENAQIYNIKRNNYDSGYTTAKKVKFTHTYDEQHNNGDLGRHEDNNDYSNSLENVQVYSIKRNNYDSGYTTAKNVKFSYANDEQQNNGELGEQDDYYDYHENNVDMLNFSGNGVHEANTEFAVISDPILDLLAETYPTENFPLLRRQNNTVVKCSTETNSESKTEVVIVSDEPSMAGKLLTEKKTETVNKRVITVQPKQQLHNSKVLTQLKAATVKNGVVKQQPQQQTSLTKAVAFAESWQQVMKTMQEEVAANSTLANMQKQPDAIALAAKKLVEEIKQAGEREKLSIHQKRIAGDLTGTNLNSKQILSTQGASSVATTQVPTKMFNKPDPNAFEITSVEIINSIPPIVAGRNPNLKLIPAIQEDPHQAKITSVEIINSKLPTNVANENTVTFSEKGTPQILQNRKEIMHMMHRPSAAKATIATTTTATNTMPLSITKPPFKTPASAAHVQPKSMDDTIEELLAKAKHIVNTKNTAAPANTNNDDDDSLKSAEPEIHFAPISTTQHAEDDGVVPYCVLKCANFRKIYEFPSPEVQTFQRHFWFIQLGLDIATDWRKTLFICDKHFDDTMLLPPDNTLNEYAYPCQSLLRELNKPTATVGTQTCDDAEEYRQKLFDQIAELKQTLCQQKLEVKRVKVLIRLKQEASRLVAEIEEAENAPKLLTIYNKE
ncbi:uncharacterized protein LOC126755476 [Bactrocera neohumeralis]|uniref:uncharacterized protein LOC126755476 n=1 Tax=Bactrocera neohumeralis TaxID=98809 RepID=UPI0021653388|nr:uncharacterized protein LOC126755476 [Bactrocera neohumeralis]